MFELRLRKKKTNWVDLHKTTTAIVQRVAGQLACSGDDLGLIDEAQACLEGDLKELDGVPGFHYVNIGDEVRLDDPTMTLADRLHLSPPGNRRVAEALAPAVRTIMSRSRLATRWPSGESFGIARGGPRPALPSRP